MVYELVTVRPQYVLEVPLTYVKGYRLSVAGVVARGGERIEPVAVAAKETQFRERLYLHTLLDEEPVDLVDVILEFPVIHEEPSTGRRIPGSAIRKF